MHYTALDCTWLAGVTGLSRRRKGEEEKKTLRTDQSKVVQEIHASLKKPNLFPQWWWLLPLKSPIALAIISLIHLNQRTHLSANFKPESTLKHKQLCNIRAHLDANNPGNSVPKPWTTRKGFQFDILQPLPQHNHVNYAQTIPNWKGFPFTARCGGRLQLTSHHVL